MLASQHRIFKLLPILLVFFSLSLSAQEDCLNGIDDDSDGLIDLNDDDCSCYDVTQVLLAADFEDMTCCPTSFNAGIDGTITCLNEPWILPTTSSTDYINTCGFIGGTVIGQVPMPIPSGNGALGFLAGTTSSGYGEYVGQCMPGLMVPGETYTVSFSLGFSSGPTYPSTSPFTVGIYGTSSCTNFPVNSIGCPLDNPNWIELGTVEVTGAEDTWVNGSFMFTVPQEIQAIGFGPACSELTGPLEYHFLDDLQISGMFGQEGVIVSDITSSGDCASGVTLSVPPVSGGSYQWYLDGVAIAGATSSTYNVPPGGDGIYTVRIETVDGCGTAPPFNLTINTNTLTVNGDITDIECFGENNGAINVNLPNGTAPFMFMWGSGQSTQNIANLAPGAYTVTVTDANGCQGTRTFVVDAPASELTGNIDDIIQPVDPQVFGSADANASGGVPGYTYLWDNGETTPTATMLSPGPHQVTVTDQNGCEIVLDVEIFEPLVIIFSSTDLNCFAECDGVIELVISGGQQDYSYDWSTGDSNPIIFDLCADTYTVTVTDNAGTTIEQQITVDQPDQLIIDWTTTELICDGGLGFVELNVIGGVPDYEYFWSNGSGDIGIYDVDAGNYSVTVTDANGCETSENFTIEIYDPIGLEGDVTTESCGGGNDGAIDLLIINGSNPFTYTWSNGQAFEDISGLASGVYTVTVSDANGCTAEESFTVSQGADIDIISNVTDASCGGASNGSIDITIDGGTPPFMFSWDNGATTEDLSNLDPGNYIVTIQDGAGCQSVELFAVAQDGGVELNGSTANVSCFGQSDGTALVEVTSGQGPYTYLWSNGAMVPDPSGLSAGMITVTITDAVGCTATESFTIGEPEEIAVAANLTNASCGGSADGAISVTAMGGAGNYTYAWSNGSDMASLSNLAGGTYMLTITDENGCTSVESYVISAAGDLTASADLNTAGCNGASDGTIDLTPAGGTPPYTFNWSNGAMTEDLSGLPATTYTVTITDANNCETVETFEILGDPQLIFDTEVNNLSCAGSTDASIMLNISGGTAPFEILWSNGATTNEIANLMPASYTVTVTDANGCTGEEQYFISAPPAITSTQSIEEVLCSGDQNGAITVNAMGGTGTLSYLWSDGSNNQSLTDLGAGNYILTITDENGCTNVQNIQLADPEAVAITPDVEDVLCNGDQNGAISISATGGTGALDFLWSDGSTTQDIANLAAGNYILTVTDENGCTSTDAIDITEPPAIGLVLISVTDPTMAGELGEAEVNANGGTGPYTYEWDNGETGPIATQLSVGEHTVTVTDANGCQETLLVEINTSLLTADFTQNPIPCFGDCSGEIVLNVNGGLPPYDYLWSDGQTTLAATGLCAGTYGVTVTDATGLEVAIVAIPVTEPAPLELDGESQDNTCVNTMDGQIDVTANGGTQPYTYLWSTGDNNADLNDLSPGSYSLTLTDALGCEQLTSFEVLGVAPISPAVSTEDIDCNNPGGQIIITGDNPDNYTYLLNQAPVTLENDSIIGGLSAGNYSLEYLVNDDCIVDFGSVDINVLSDFDIQVSPLEIELTEGDNANIELSLNGTISGYTVTWSSLDPFSCLETNAAGECISIQLVPLEDQSILVTVEDEFGCLKSLEVVIRVKNQLKTYIANIFSPNGDGINDIFKPQSSDPDAIVKSMTLFDRWGEIVYAEENIQLSALAGWDGSLAGKQMLPGVYVYVLEMIYSDTAEELIQGDVTLIR